MKNFYEIMQKATDLPKTSVGLLIVDSVIRTRVDLNDIYRSGDAKDYRNKELSRVVEGLEHACADTTNTSSIPICEALAFKFHERLMKYRDIERLNFFYDGVKVTYQLTQGEPHERILAAARICETALEQMLRASKNLPDYARMQRSAKIEHGLILIRMRNIIQAYYGRVYQVDE